ncbi:Uncharacterised protein [Legionella hackeliae]|nr:Uncharacterised protein [Legionella hackeliae]
MEWLKLFGNHNDKHHWKKIIHNSESFKNAMLNHCNVTPEEFEMYHKEMKSYRDQFIAHLDSELTMRIPNLTKILL